MVRSVRRDTSNATFLSKFGYCLAGEGVAPTADLHGRYLLSMAVLACMADELRDRYDPKSIGGVLGIKVLLADDHRLLVAGFHNMLKDYGVDAAEVAYNLDGLIDHFLETKLDILVIDVYFDNKGRDENGLGMCEELLTHSPSAKIIVLGQFDNRYTIGHSYKLDMLAFMHKNESTEVLNEAINTIAQGREYFSPEIARLLTRSAVRDQNPNRPLDENEMRAFSPAADGASMIKIAAVMDLSIRAIDHLMKGAKAKLGAEN